MFILAGNGIVKILFEMIQTGGALSKWQRVLEWLYSHEYYKLEMMIGGCKRCFSFWFMPLWFGCFYLFVTPWPLNWYCSIIWYIVFHVLGAEGGNFILNYKKKTNGV